MGSSASTEDAASEDILARLFRSGRTNALISWSLMPVLVLVFIESVGDVDWQWILFVTVVGGIVLVPPARYRDWRVMLPWELLVLALLPIIARALLGEDLGVFAYYLAVAGLALIVTVELHMFTKLSLTHWFAVGLVVMTTLASVAAWSILRWAMDAHLGTTFLVEPGMSQDAANDALMIEFLWVTLAGVAAGILFDAYFRRRGRALRRRLWRVIPR